MILDPREITFNSITGSFPLSEQPTNPEIRKLGFIPNKRRLFPGDLILTKAFRDKSKFSTFTRKAQRQRFVSNTDWTHAAVYYQDWLTVEATPEKHVSVGTLLPLITDHIFMIRRGLFIDNSINAGNVDFARSIGLKIVVEASFLQKKASYGKLTAASIYTQAVYREPLFIHNETSQYSVICSGLYAKSYRLATGRGLLTAEQDRNDESITPALLANTEELVTINVGWAGLNPS